MTLPVLPETVWLTSSGFIDGIHVNVKCLPTVNWPDLSTWFEQATVVEPAPSFEGFPFNRLCEFPRIRPAGRFCVEEVNPPLSSRARKSRSKFSSECHVRVLSAVPKPTRPWQRFGGRDTGSTLGPLLERPEGSKARKGKGAGGAGREMAGAFASNRHCYAAFP